MKPSATSANKRVVRSRPNGSPKASYATGIGNGPNRSLGIRPCPQQRIGERGGDIFRAKRIDKVAAFDQR